MNLEDAKPDLDEEFERVYGAYQRGKMDAIAWMPPHRMFIYSYYADEYQKGYKVGVGMRSYRDENYLSKKGLASEQMY